MGTLDPSIILGIRQPQIAAVDPMEQYGKSLALRNLMQQGDLHTLQYQQAQLGAADDAAVRSAYQQSAGDPATLRALLAKGGNYKAVQELDKANLEIRAKTATAGKDEAAARKSDLEGHLDRLARGAAILGTAKDQQSYDTALRAGQLAGVFAPEAVQKMAAQPFSPQLVQGLQAAGIKRSEQLKAEHDAGTLAATVRGQDMTAATAAAGQGVTMRGQNMAQGTAIRGQDMVNARALETRDAGRWTNDLERGIQVNSATGESRPITAGGVQIAPKDKPLTESQGKATGMAMRAEKAHNLLLGFEDSGVFTPGVIKQGAGAVPLIGGGLEMGVNKLPVWAGGPSAKQQQVEQAQRDFVNAALRVESGAAISESEFNNARKQYFPQPGDSKPVIEQKRRNRETEIDSLKLQGGPGAKAIKSSGVDPAKLSDAELLRELRK